jgi:hypothetical protein
MLHAIRDLVAGIIAVAMLSVFAVVAVAVCAGVLVLVMIGEARVKMRERGRR